MKRVLSVLFILCTAICSLAHAAAPPKTWTFLIYLNGNNSLDEFGAQNIKDMEKVGSNDQVNVVVEWASLSAHKTVRLLIQKNPNPSSKTIVSPIIQDLGAIDMGSMDSLKDFIAWGVQNYPAEHYFIDVWNHGSGWHALKGMRNGPGHLGDISVDDVTHHTIKTEQLGEVMTYAAGLIGHKVDIYGSDACLMAMAEVANEMADSVNYFVGSQETEPGAGWPYDVLLSQWEAIPNATPEQISKILVSAYVKLYRDNPNPNERDEVTFSAYDMSKLSDLNLAISNLASKIQQLTPSERSKLITQLGKKKILRFAISDYGDLLDFAKQLTAINPKVFDANSLSTLQKAAQAVIFANEDTKKYARASGMSIWLPMDFSTYKVDSDRYENLKFNAITHWNSALGTLLQGAKLANNA